LKEEGLLEKEAQFENVDQLLDSLEKPHHAWPRRSMFRPLMSPAFAGVDGNSIAGAWTQAGRASVCQAHQQPMGELKDEAARQGRSIFETSS